MKSLIVKDSLPILIFLGPKIRLRILILNALSCIKTETKYVYTSESEIQQYIWLIIFQNMAQLIFLL